MTRCQRRSPIEAAQRNEKWIERNKVDLTSAILKREALTGSASILPYGTKNNPDRYCVFVGEGMNVSVAVTYDDYGYRYFHGAGKVQASSNPADMRLQRTLGHISALTNYAQTKKTPEDVLVVACGAGVTAGSFVPYGSNITIVDIEEMVPKYVTPQFWDVNHDVIPPSWSHRPTGYRKTNIIIDDGRHYIKTLTNKKFDVITSDPIDPWVKGYASLNTVEYYQMRKDHLKPGKVMALWIPPCMKAPRTPARASSRRSSRCFPTASSGATTTSDSATMATPMDMTVCCLARSAWIRTQRNRT